MRAAELESWQVSPGLPGFLVMFGLALATLVLVRSMVRHLRNVRYADEPEPEAPPSQQPGSAKPADPRADQPPATRD